MHGTYSLDARTEHARRLAEACPRFPAPACDIASGAENIAEARIILDEVETAFGVCQALVTIEGRPDDWRLVSIEVPTDIAAFSRYAAAKSPRWFREDWEAVSERGSWVERELWRAARATITEDMATAALCAAVGV